MSKKNYIYAEIIKILADNIGKDAKGFASAYTILDSSLGIVDTILTEAEPHKQFKVVSDKMDTLSNFASDLKNKYQISLNFAQGYIDNGIWDIIIDQFNLLSLSDLEIDRFLESHILLIEHINIGADKLNTLTSELFEAIQYSLTNPGSKTIPNNETKIITDKKSMRYLYDYDDETLDKEETRDFKIDFNAISSNVLSNNYNLILSKEEKEFFTTMPDFVDEFDMLNHAHKIFSEEENYFKSFEQLLDHIDDVQTNYRWGWSDLHESVMIWLTDDDIINLKQSNIAGWILLIIMSGYDEPIFERARSRYSNFHELFFHNSPQIEVLENKYTDFDFCKVALVIDPSIIGYIQKIYPGNSELIEIVANTKIKFLKYVNKTFVSKITNLDSKTISLIKENGRTLRNKPILEYVSNL